MCTVSWIHDEDGYHLLCNRDEKRTRLPASPPQIERLNGVSVVAPRDGDHGGSWIACNEYGVAISLLNGTQPGPRMTGLSSRGQLVIRLANSRSLPEVCERAHRTDLSEYAPFSLVVLQSQLPAALIEWSGTKRSILSPVDSYSPLASSSYDAVGVQLARCLEYKRLIRSRLASGGLHSFHISHGVQAGPYSTCMHRPDAETVSFSWIRVSRSSLGFYYAPGPPCRRTPGVRTNLRLV